MVTRIFCQEGATSIEISKHENYLSIQMDGAFAPEPIELFMSISDLHSFIGHLLKIQKEIREEVQNGN